MGPDDFTLIGLPGHIDLGFLGASGLLQLGLDFLPALSASLALGNISSSSEPVLALILEQISSIIELNTAEYCK